MKRKVFVLIAILFSFVMLVNAEGNEDLLTTGINESVPETVFYAEDNITVEEEQNSSQFIFGNQVIAKSKIAGLSFIAGYSMDISGTAEYGLYAGNTITINSNIEKDLFVAGNVINIGCDAKIGRDVYLAGNIMKINANLPRDLRAAGTTVDISNITINGDAYIDANQIIMNDSTIITGKLSYIEGATFEGKDKASIGKIETRKDSDIGEIEINFGSKLTSQLISVAAGIIVMIALFYMIPALKKKLDETELTASSIIGTIGKGVGVLIVIPIVSIIALVTGILTPLALIVLALYGIGLYLASILSGYIIGRTIMTGIFKKDNQYLSILLGILLIRLLGLVPIVSGIISIICFLYGMGLIYNIIKKKN